jgi:hypothetical protein
VTEGVYLPNTTYSVMLEGWGYGKMNNEGYINLDDYHPGDTIHTLIIGSSHMEALQVPLAQTTVSLLNRKLGETASPKRAYNIGMGAHGLLIYLKHLENALAVYRPQDYLVLEIPGLHFDAKSLEEALDGKYPNLYPPPVGRLGMLLKQMPFTYLVRVQIGDMLAKPSPANAKTSNSKLQTPNNAVREQNLLAGVLEKITDISQKYSVQPILLIHPRLSLQLDGSAVEIADVQEKANFHAAAKIAGIQVIDMSEIFLNEYKGSAHESVCRLLLDFLPGELVPNGVGLHPWHPHLAGRRVAALHLGFHRTCATWHRHSVRCGQEPRQKVH